MKELKDVLIKSGLMFDYSGMITEETLIELIGDKKEEYFGSANEYGERAFRAVGKKKTLIVWDCGNSWYQVIAEE